MITVPLADWATKIAPQTQSSLTSDPGINWVTPIYDSMSMRQQGITAAGKAASVHIASYNGTPAVMKLIQNGNIMSMDVGENITWLAYATSDQVGRVITGSPIVAGGEENTRCGVHQGQHQRSSADNLTGYGNAYVTGYGALWKGQ